jgi:hypothetical protein
MELVGGLLAFLGSGGGAAAGAGAAAAGAAGGGLASLSGLATTFSVVGALGSGLATLGAANAQAKEHEFASRDEFITGKETSAALKLELARTLADQSVAFAAGGVNLGSVSVGTAKKQAIHDAEKEIDVASNEALARSLAQKRAARQARASGKWGLFTSVLKAGGIAANAGMDMQGIG